MRDPPIEPMEAIGSAVCATSSSSFDSMRLAAFETLADRLSCLDAQRDAGSPSTVTRSIRSPLLRRTADAAKKFAEQGPNGGK